jgi:hypothetical protein
MLNRLKDSGDVIDIKTVHTTHIREKMGLQYRYESLVEQIEKDNDIIKEKYNVSIRQLEELGCNLVYITGPKYQVIPDHYYIWKEYDDYGVPITVGCHEHTKLYKFLYSSGLLEKYFPKWYRDGNF